MTAQLSPLGVQKFYDNNGNPLAFGLLYSYAAGTTTPQATYVDSTQAAQNTNPIQLNFRGECNLWLDPTLTYKLLLTDSAGNTIPNWPVDNIPGGPFINATGSIVVPASLIPTPTNTFTLGNSTHSWANVYVGVNDAPVLDTVSGNIGYYARTAGEISAGVTPTNYAYPPLYVDRYGTNITPGTTSMVAAFQAAINVAKHGSSGNGSNVVTYGRTAPYLLDGPLDCTTGPGQTPSANGIIIRGEAQYLAITNNAPAYPGLLVKHTGHVFDCTGTYGIVFENVTIGTDLTTYPQTGWFLARGTDKNSQHVHFLNCGFIGKASKAVLYNFGSENTLQLGCTFINRATDAGAKTVWLTSTNILGLTSTFQTVASGGGTPCTVHLFLGGEYHNWGSSATGDVFAFDACSKVTLADFFLSTGSATTACRSYVYCETANGPTNNVSIRGVVSENNTFNPTYGITFGTTAATPAAWRVDNCDFTVVTSKLFAPAAVICDGFYITAILNDTGSPTINFAGTLQNSVIDDVESTITIGTSITNRITASAGSLTVTTRNGDFWSCPGVQTWTPNTSALTITGALSISNKRVQYSGSEVTVTMDMSAATSIVCAQGTALSGLPIAGLVDSAVALVTNRNTGILIGTAQVSGTSLLLPAINVGANVVVTITAKYFCA